jgi:putative PIN family toxin of toxin-antitoxin system
MRVVIDTNIWVSGLLWRGLPWELLRLADADQVSICAAPPMLNELERVLNYDRLQPRLTQLGLHVTDLMTYALNLVSIFELPPATADTPIVIADPDDDIFVRCAMTAEAVYIVSGDQHLLALEQHAHISILTIRDFLTKEFPATLSD